jgi:hypothetical protein
MTTGTCLWGEGFKVLSRCTYNTGTYTLLRSEQEVPSTRKYMYTNTKTDTHTNTLKKIRFGMNNNGAPNAKQIY